MSRCSVTVGGGFWLGDTALAGPICMVGLGHWVPCGSCVLSWTPPSECFMGSPQWRALSAGVVWQYHFLSRFATRAAAEFWTHAGSSFSVMVGHTAGCCSSQGWWWHPGIDQRACNRDPQWCSSTHLPYRPSCTSFSRTRLSRFRTLSIVIPRSETVSLTVIVKSQT